MKRSEMIKSIKHYLDAIIQHQNDKFNTEFAATDILTLVEKAGMLPSPVKARVIKGENFSWGVGCSMRCICEYCDRDFPINVWEEE